MKNWKVPGIILVLLILIISFRWSNDGTKITDSSIIKYRTDHWTGEILYKTYNYMGYSEKIIKPNTLGVNKNTLTLIWEGLTGVNIIWLLYAVSKIEKKKNINENNSINT